MGVPQNRRVVHDPVDTAPGIHRALDESAGTVDGRYVLGARHGFASGRDDFIDDRGGHRRIRSTAARAATEVVDDDAGTAPAQFGGLGASDTARAAGDDDDLAVEPYFRVHAHPRL